MEPEYDDQIKPQDNTTDEDSIEADQEVEQSNQADLNDNTDMVEGEVGDFIEDDQEAAPVEKDSKAEKKRFHEHIAEIQRIKYQALKENELLRAENERLSRLSNASVQTALQHYEEAASQRLQAAKELKQRAYDSGDIKEQIDADMALTLAVSELQTINQKKAENIAMQQPYYQQGTQQPYYQGNPQYQPAPSQYPQYSPPPIDQEAEAKSWVERNPWFDPKSEVYDEWMSREMHNYCNALDNNLYRNGLGSKIMSGEYFETIDNYAKNLAEYRARNSKGDLNMQRAPNTVSPVRGNNGVNQQRRQHEIKPSSEEREWARRLGVTDKVYLQYKIADIKKQRELGS